MRTMPKIERSLPAKKNRDLASGHWLAAQEVKITDQWGLVAYQRDPEIVRRNCEDWGTAPMPWRVEFMRYPDAEQAARGTPAAILEIWYSVNEQHMNELIPIIVDAVRALIVMGHDFRIESRKVLTDMVREGINGSEQ